MAKKAASSPVPVTVNKTEALTKAAEVQKLLPTLQTEVAELVIEDENAYLYADALLGRIKDSRAGWGKVWERIQERTITPIRRGLEELYSLNREVDKPLETLYESVRTKMHAYKAAEAKLLQDAQAARDREEARLRSEAEAKARAAEAARTPQLKGRLEAARQKLEEQASQVAVAETPEPVEGQRSTTRTVPSWRVKDFPAFLRGVADSMETKDGVIPAESVILNMPVINRRFKSNPDELRAWPGLEVYDDVQIVGR